MALTLQIPDKFIDIDLNNVPSGQNAGLIKESDDQIAKAFGAVSNFSDLFPQKMVPRGEWKGRIDKLYDKMRKTVTKIYSQGNEGSCVGFGMAQAVEIFRRRMFGLPHWVSLSGMSIYNRIGSSPNSGAMISDGMKAALIGILPLDTEENKKNWKHTHPLHGFRTKLVDGWLETGKNFRVAKYAKAQGVEEIMTVLVLGHCGIVGRDGHCVPYCIPAYKANDFFADYANSWDEDWGDSGHGYDSERKMNQVTLYIPVDVVTSPDVGAATPEIAL